MADATYYVYANGLMSADTATLLVDIQKEWLDAFGGSLSVDASTPQGRIIEIQTAERRLNLDLAALTANQINPDYATGQYLDALASLFGVERVAATRSVVRATIGGVPGTIVTSGFIAQSGDHQFTTYTNVTIGPTGTAENVIFYSVETGPIPCTSGTLTNIVTPAPGVETVTNAQGPIIIGGNEEPDSLLRPRMKDSRYSREALPGAVRSAMNAVPDVISYWFYNNGEGAPVYIAPDGTVVYVNGEDAVTKTITPDGVTTIFGYDGAGGVKVIDANGNVTTYAAGDAGIPTAPIIDDTYVMVDAHSIIMVVEGGDPKAIAEALFTTRSAGCGFTAIPDHDSTEYAQVVNITDKAGPFTVTYPVTFNRPEAVKLDCHIYVKRSHYTGTDAELIAAVKSAVADWAAGKIDGVDKPEIGDTVYTYEIGAAISQQIPEIGVRNVYIAYNAASHIDSDWKTRIDTNKKQLAVIATVSVFIREV